MLLTFSILVALMIDWIVGEPRRWHPLVGFGNAAIGLEKMLNSMDKKSPFLLRLRGLIAWALLVLPIVIFFSWFEKEASIYAEVILGIVCLAFALGSKSLVQHARAVSQALKDKDMALARQSVAMIVSRDTSNSDEKAINVATVESVLENGSDAIFAAIFWFVILGAPGVVLYRLSNTLDAMWGYRTERFNSFGWAAARIDDVLNWLPARLTALSYALVGNLTAALSSWRAQAKHWYGINPGVVMATGAGALSVKLGGTAIYHGEKVERPVLGCGSEPQVADIDRAVQLVNKSIVIWLLVIVLGEYFFA